MNSMEIELSDILSIAAIIGSIYTYFRTKKKIDKQQLAINEYTIEKNKKEKQVEKPRDFDPFGQTGFAHLWLQYD